ncbi:aminotransferase class III-fold pyridoxal phosphate-dependent enzyme [Candidatus Uabimicrobium amorphum]|uniref:Glutamate-1-semialdehyde 2,1-aminomutase n=1 Tax=Uabimicrobium amorphum TaxID=2596890 RepID=A0A5S9II89_UABAM|nr:aminotransferase class III-fold pyridoxal phosphate-dependent enzyme [Candidatus Uabimicrobium amorphum]BBM82283.1 glutamate-1-semialdehyde 2,1-aminomutase [Candidatus Uabimicrobium amorphum]
MRILHLCKFFIIVPWVATKLIFVYFFIRKRDERLDRFGHHICNCLQSLGPFYIKMGQILATRSDLIPQNITSKLAILQDNVPGDNKAYVKKLLIRELGNDYPKIFSDFDFEALASASIAQVHKATLQSGETVAVKIVKKNVKQQLTGNFFLLNILLWWLLLFFPILKKMRLRERYNEIKKLLVEQTDMVRELAHQKVLYKNFIGHPYIVIPKAYDEFCSQNILVLEYITAIRGQEFSRVNFPKDQLARRLQDSVYTMLYLDGFSHGDPHPGNIFFTEDGKLIFLDFGIVTILSEREKWGLSSFYYACTRNEWDIAVDRFTEHFVTDKQDIHAKIQQYRQDLYNTLKYHFHDKTNRWSTMEYFKDVNQVLQKYNACYTTNFTKVELVFLSCEGFACQIDPQIDIWGNARKFTDRFSPYMSDEVKQKFDRYFQETIPRSLQVTKSAKQHLVAPTHFDRYFFPSTYPLVVKKAYGCKIEDIDNNTYIDVSCGYGPHILGYAHPVINEALQKASQQGSINALGHFPEIELAKIISEAFPSAEKVIFSNSGTEAVIQALRICRAYRKKDMIAKFEGHYHGFSDQGMVSSWFRFSGQKKNPDPIAGTLGSVKSVVNNTLVLQYGDPGALEQLLLRKDELAAIICEPLPTSMAKIDHEFLQQLREFCSTHDIPLIFDEVVSGFRVHYGGAQVVADVEPDLTCLGKIIGGGLPCGAVTGKKELIDVAKSSGDPFIDYEQKTFVGGTMSGNSLSCAAGLATLSYLRENKHIYEQLHEQTNWLTTQLEEIAQNNKISLQVSGYGSIFSFTFSHKKSKFYREKQSGSNFKANLALAYYMRKHGIYMPELHTLMLNAAHNMEDLEKITAAFEKSLCEMTADGIFVL